MILNSYDVSSQKEKKRKEKFLMMPFSTLLGQRMKPQAQPRKPKKDKRKRDCRGH